MRCVLQPFRSHCRGDAVEDVSIGAYGASTRRCLFRNGLFAPRDLYRKQVELPRIDQFASACGASHRESHVCDTNSRTSAPVQSETSRPGKCGGCAVSSPTRRCVLDGTPPCSARSIVSVVPCRFGSSRHALLTNAPGIDEPAVWPASQTAGNRKRMQDLAALFDHCPFRPVQYPFYIGVRPANGPESRTAS